jgi:hypothetical protein
MSLSGSVSNINGAKVNGAKVNGAKVNGAKVNTTTDIWTNNSPFKKAVKINVMPDYIPVVKEALIKFFKDGWNKSNKGLNTNTSKDQLFKFINKILKENDAVISGGFILKAIGAFVDPKSVDIDIYVPTKNVVVLKKVMEKLFKFENVDIRIAQPESKHTKDGILSVSKYSKGEPGTLKYAEMDIVEVSEGKTPIDIIKNFDFSFCENWYDGEAVFMEYPEDVENKTGFLEKHYMDLLYEGDLVLFKRIQKYIARGFTISIKEDDSPPKNIADLVNIDLFLQTLESIRTNKSIIVLPKYTDSIGAQIMTKIQDRIRPDGCNIKTSNLKDITTNKPFASRTLPDMGDQLTQVDKATLNHYTGFGSNDINTFLYKTTPFILITNNNILNWIKSKFSKKNIESHIDYNTRLLYYYFVNLYNTVQKGLSVCSQLLPPLFRGVTEWYLDKNTDKFYYTNSFMSTSSILTEDFGTKIYALYIHPLCRYLNIENQSSHPDEHEVLLTPYHRYMFVEEEEGYLDKFTIRKYIVLPVDFNIPNTFEKYMVWKEDILLKTSILKNANNYLNAASKGGRVQTSQKVSNIRHYNKTKKNTPRIVWINKKAAAKNITNKLKLINNTNNTNNTYKLDKNKMLSPRFTDPIPSFPGKAPNIEELKVINKMRQIIMKDKKTPVANIE